MSKQEEETLQKLADSMAELSNEAQSYIVGLADGMALAKDQKPAESEDE